MSGYWVVDLYGKPKSGPFDDYETASTEAGRCGRSQYVGDRAQHYIRYGTKDEVTFA